ncbi:MAG: hypothetical protein ACE5E9_13390 [Nitrospinaceae bacterium]
MLVLAWGLAGWLPGAWAEEESALEEKARILNRQIAFYQEQLKIKPENPELHFSLGTKYYELGRYFESRANRVFFTGANQKDLREANQLYDHSIDQLRESLKLQPRNAGAHFNLSLNYFVKGDGENAIVHMREAEQLFFKLDDKRGVAKARKALREWFDRYGYRPEDFGRPAKEGE